MPWTVRDTTDGDEFDIPDEMYSYYAANPEFQVVGRADTTPTSQTAMFNPNTAYQMWEVEQLWKAGQLTNEQYQAETQRIQALQGNEVARYNAGTTRAGMLGDLRLRASGPENLAQWSNLMTGANSAGALGIWDSIMGRSAPFTFRAPSQSDLHPMKFQDLGLDPLLEQQRQSQSQRDAYEAANDSEGPAAQAQPQAQTATQPPVTRSTGIPNPNPAVPADMVEMTVIGGDGLPRTILVSRAQMEAARGNRMPAGSAIDIAQRQGTPVQNLVVGTNGRQIQTVKTVYGRAGGGIDVVTDPTTFSRGGQPFLVGEKSHDELLLNTPTHVVTIPLQNPAVGVSPEAARLANMQVPGSPYHARAGAGIPHFAMTPVGMAGGGMMPIAGDMPAGPGMDPLSPGGDPMAPPDGGQMALPPGVPPGSVPIPGTDSFMAPDGTIYAPDPATGQYLPQTPGAGASASPAAGAPPPLPMGAPAPPIGMAEGGMVPISPQATLTPLNVPWNRKAIAEHGAEPEYVNAAGQIRTPFGFKAHGTNPDGSIRYADQGRKVMPYYQNQPYVPPQYLNATLANELNQNEALKGMFLSTIRAMGNNPESYWSIAAHSRGGVRRDIPAFAYLSRGAY